MRFGLGSGLSYCRGWLSGKGASWVRGRSFQDLSLRTALSSATPGALCALVSVQLSTHLKQNRILLIGGGLSGGGGERHFNMLAKWLYGGSADVLVVARPGLPCRRNPLFPLRPGAVIAFGQAIEGCLRGRYDVIFGFGRFASFVAFGLHRVAGRKAALVLMDISVFLRAHQADARWYKAIPLWGCRAAYGGADILLANSLSGAKQLATLTHGRVPASRVPNLVDPGWIASASRASEAPAANETPYVLALGRLVPSKRLDAAIRGFSRMAAQVPHRFLIAGDG